jgi:hypothetical protein
MKIRNVAASMLIGLSLAACGFKPDPIPAAVANTSGGVQTIAPSAQAAPLVVTVRDQEKDPIGGITVLWNIESGAGTLSATSTTTDDNGNASVTYTAGATVGITKINATVPALQSSVSYTITVK